MLRWLAPGIVSVLLTGCSPSEKAPLTRDVEVSIAFAWTNAPQQRPANVEVGALPYDKVRPVIKIALMKRDSTVDEAWKEKQKRATEIEKLKGDIVRFGHDVAPPPPRSAGSRLKNDVDACRETLNNLADTAVLYIEDVKQKLGADFDKERVERFRKNLGADELRDLSLAIRAENSPAVRKALADARGILERDVWAGKADARERGLRIIAQMEHSVASASPAAMPAGDAVPKAAEDLQKRILAVMKDESVWDSRLAAANRPILMYTALGDAEIHAKTDAAGTSHLILPREGRWVLFAYVDRPFPTGMSELEQSLRVAEKEEMVWIVEAPGDGSEHSTITLSENDALRPAVAPLKLDLKGE
ncbi:MAG: hypothetical protein ABI318_03185 [Chthoniobacteraceae bacterium]